MAVNFIQPSFAAGEIAPSLYARVDLAKYHIGAKLLRNMFVWPHGGVSNRGGTMFVGWCLMSAYNPVLIPFQFNLLQTYILEFGHQYMRVIMNGGYVLEPTFGITGITNANPGVLTVDNHGYQTGDQVFIAGTGTLLDSTPGRQYFVQVIDSNTFSLTDLDGNVIDTTNYGTFNLTAASVARVYTMPTPYSGADVPLIKWTQSADTMTLCHPNYPPCDLTRTEHWVWTLTQISFAPTIPAPTGATFANGGSGSWYYSYVVTAVSNTPPDESYASTACGGTGAQLNSDTGVANTISWTAAPGAVMYRIYKANPQVTAIPTGAMYGYIGTATGTGFVDVEIAPDFTQSPPQGTNPFSTGTITAVAVTNGGSGYGANTVLNVSDVTGTGAVLQANVSGGVIELVSVTAGGSGYQGPTVSTSGGSGATAFISAIETKNIGYGPYQAALTIDVTNGGSGYFGAVRVTAPTGKGFTFHPVISNGVITAITATENQEFAGSGYSVGEQLTITGPTGSGATFTVTVQPEGNYPACCCYFQQRKVFAGGSLNPQTLWMTRPADFKNMDISNPSQASDAITATLISNKVDAIKHMVPMNNLIVFTAGGAWMIVGGYINNPVPVTPSNIVAAPQNYVGCCDLPPIVVNYDILYVQAKGSIVRDLAYNFFANVYTGTDMSILSNHLFFGHNMVRWAYAEQPYYQIWTVRDDGMLLSFTYLKEQDVYAWAHHDSPGVSGTDQFLSVASIPEQQVPGINVDSVYFVVQRTVPGINGGSPVNYIERMDSRNMLTNGVSDVTKAWFVDCGLQYNGSPTNTVTGLDHLNGATVTGLADGSVFAPQIVQGGSITLPFAASKITVGLSFTAQLQTLCMEPEGMAMQVQDYRKKISAVAVRVADTRGLKVGPDFTRLTEIKMRGPTVPMGAAIPLFTGDQRLVIDNEYLVDDDVCIQQDQPLPCTVLGVIPEVAIGDSPG